MNSSASAPRDRIEDRNFIRTILVQMRSLCQRENRIAFLDRVGDARDEQRLHRIVRDGWGTRAFFVV